MSKSFLQKNKYPTKWTIFFASIIFFSLIPILLMSIGWKFISTNRFSRLEHENTIEIRKKLNYLKRESNNEIFIQRKLDYFYGLISEAPINSKTIEKQLTFLKSNELNFLRIAFFDKNQKRIHFKGESTSYKTLLNHIFQAIIQPEVENKSTLLVKYRPFFDGFLGVESDPTNIVYEKSNLRKASINGKKGYFYWNSFYDNATNGKFKGGFVAYCYESDIPKMLAIKVLVKSLNNSTDKKRKFGIINIGDSNKIKNKETQNMLKAIQLANKKYSTNLIYGNKLFVFQEISRDNIIFALQDLGKQNFRNLTFLLNLMAIVFVVIVTRISFNTNIAGNQHFIPIGKKLTFLFLYAALIPLIAFIIVGHQHVISQRRILTQDKYDHLSNYVRNVDKSYTRAVYKLEDKYNELVNSQTLKALNFSGIQKLADKLRKKRQLSFILIANSRGKIVFSSQKKRGERNIVRQLIPTLARRLFNTKKGKSFSIRSKMKDMMVESFTDSLSELITSSKGKSGFFKNFENMEKINELWLANKRFYTFNSFMKTYTGKTYLVFIWNETWKFSEKYLSNLVKENVSKGFGTDNIKLAIMPVKPNKLPYPREFSKYPFISEMSNRVKTTGTEIHDDVDIGGEQWMAVASPLKQIPTFILFAMYPSTLINNAIYKYSLNMLFVSLVSLIFAVFIGINISQQFLVPVKELDKGIKRLKARDFSHRVPILANDELGKLSEAFNNMILNVDEIAGASMVQSLLLPKSHINWADFEIMGKSESLGDIGGDYFDYFDLDETYSVFLIGDVAGHGVRSALIMAIAKTIVSVMQKETLTKPAEALKYMNGIIIKTLHRRLLMTFFLGVLNKNTGEIKIANAGHCFPILCRKKDRNISFVDLPAYPLGGRKKTNFIEHSISLESGDSLVMYSDGWPSSSKNNGDILSFDSFSGIVSNFIFSENNLNDIYQKINEEYLSATDRLKDSDDRTLIILRKK